jgi:hypothetical protein
VAGGVWHRVRQGRVLNSQPALLLAHLRQMHRSSCRSHVMHSFVMAKFFIHPFDGVSDLRLPYMLHLSHSPDCRGFEPSGPNFILTELVLRCPIIVCIDYNRTTGICDHESAAVAVLVRSACVRFAVHASPVVQHLIREAKQ